MRLKNLLHACAREAQILGLRRRDLEERLEPLSLLLPDGDFWSHQSAGLCAFAAPGLFRLWRLPGTFEDCATVADHFHVRPLLATLDATRPFLVLAIGPLGARLLLCDGYSVERAVVHDLPEPVASAAEGSAGPLDSAMLSETTEDTEDYVGAVYAAVCAHRAEHDLLGLPLILACHDAVARAYDRAGRDMSRHHEIVEGDPNGASDEELREQASRILARDREERRERAIEGYERHAAQRRTTSDPVEAIALAKRGAVECLFLKRTDHVWGRITTRSVEVRAKERCPGDVDVLDAIAAATFVNGGEVHDVGDHVPGGGSLAALLRSRRRARRDDRSAST